MPDFATQSGEVRSYISIDDFIAVNSWQCNQTFRRLSVNLFPMIKREGNHKIYSTKKLKICQLLNINVWKQSLGRIGRRSYERP
jgi:hypothetical protein